MGGFSVQEQTTVSLIVPLHKDSMNSIIQPTHTHYTQYSLPYKCDRVLGRECGTKPENQPIQFEWSEDYTIYSHQKKKHLYLDQMLTAISFSNLVPTCIHLSFTTLHVQTPFPLSNDPTVRLEERDTEACLFNLDTSTE